MTCTRCDRPTADAIYLCHEDSTRLEEVLDQIPDALATARDTIARLDVVGGGKGGGSAGSKVPVNLTAAEYADDLTGKVVSWARQVLEEDDNDALRNIEPVTYLKMSLHIIRAHDWAGLLVDELDDAHRKVIRTVDAPPEIRTLGQCGTKDCAGTIRCRKGDNVARCRECGERYDAKAIEAWRISEAWEESAPLAVIVRALNAAEHPIRHATARKWVERGKLVANESGQFTMAQVYNMYAGMKQKVRAG